MLSRIAESLFWIGRYVERADGTARILDVHLERLNHLPLEEQRSVARDLLAVMGAKPQNDDFGLPELLHALAYDKQSASSIAGSLGAARENARRARKLSPSPSGKASTPPTTGSTSTARTWWAPTASATGYWNVLPWSGAWRTPQ